MKIGNKVDNFLNVSFKSISENESLARLIISSFVLPLNPTIDELNDIKTSVSEAVTNSIIHAYNNEDNHLITMEAFIRNREVTIKIIDDGIGIKDIDRAKEPLYTSKPELERSGLGFTIMESFMDELSITSKEGDGTTLIMSKKISSRDNTYNE
ncbi:anti-sigma F factor [Anaerofustis stercorihominis]|uniref:Anti-sigma F factor n=2 Tax=Anaerofustis stercorihominis TaxID=214853 RepID=B1C7W0_9FIRM|nr:anti-sigma F factor [Anaerofustis stercorihominis]EDS73097.1 anti-sigma F factor [Anaerofustis stercorihominis DSM 17244]MCQ4794408.1 anti-sigma F factor [Anaerofustis stercorihominis]RGD74363.1 anti-sigma F factor [Anaerofustis stercorihominis]